MARVKTADTDTGAPGGGVMDLLESAKDAFYHDDNIIGFGIGHRRKAGKTHDDETVLIAYVKTKLPRNDVAGEHMIPSEFQGMPTDVVAPFGVDAPQEALGFADSHQHSDDMSFVDWERLHAQWQAEAGGQIAWHGKVQAFGDVCVIEDDGTLVKTINGQPVVDFVRAYKMFRTMQPDIYDFVSFFTDTASGMPPQGGSSWYRFVHNDIQGIGLGNFNSRPAYGSNKLQGIMFLNQGHFPIWRYVMLQEQGHRWGSFARYRDSAAGPSRTDHMLGGWGHWSPDLDDDFSPMDYDIHDWVEEGDNTFRRISLSSEQRTYCNLDLYLMGLLGALEVGDFSLLSKITPVSGNLYSADEKRLTTQNVIWAEGPRNPTVATSQKLFKNGFVVLTKNLQEVHDLVDEVDRLRLRFESDFFAATKNLGQVDTTLGPLRGSTSTDFRTVSITIPAGTGRRSITGTATFASNVRRASVALNGFRLDYVSSDHHINIVEADTDIVSIDGNVVTFRVQCDYADKNFDDSYRGYVTVLVIAEIG